MIEPLVLIQQINRLHPDLYESCTRGNCYQFHLLLKLIYNDAIPYYNSSHVITKIGDRFYDIGGECDPDGYMDMRFEPLWINQAHLWKYDAKLESKNRTSNTDNL